MHYRVEGGRFLYVQGRWGLHMTLHVLNAPHRMRTYHPTGYNNSLSPWEELPKVPGQACCWNVRVDCRRGTGSRRMKRPGTRSGQAPGTR